MVRVLPEVIGGCVESSELDHRVAVCQALEYLSTVTQATDSRLCSVVDVVVMG